MTREIDYYHKLSTLVRWLVGVIIAVAVSVTLSYYVMRDNLVARCEDNGASKIIDAHFYESAAKKNRAVAKDSTGDVKSANEDAVAEYDKLAIAKRMTIPMPDGWHGPATTRGDSTKDRHAGCQDALKPPIPFVQ